LRPVTITAGVPAGAPDQIDVLYGDSSFYVSQDPLQGATATAKTLRRRNGFRPGDLAVVAGNPGAGFGSATCALVEITGAANPDNKTLDHGIANYTSVYTGPNKVVRYNTVAGVGAGFTGGMMYSLGPNPQQARWQITTRPNGISALSRTELIFNTPQLDVAENVINLKALYGVDADNNLRITDVPNEWTPVAPADFTQVLAIRVAVLVRSRQFERSADGSAAAPTGITPNQPTYFNGTAFVMTNLDGTPDAFGGAPNTPDPNNWRFYRYRVYEKVIPLRNMIWGTSP
jgi:type IV pilus assembly protein PilW